MAEIVNLRTMRKRKIRAEKEREADRNRTLHGLTKAEREGREAERLREARRLDGHHLSGNVEDEKA